MDLNEIIARYLGNLPPKKKFLVRSGLNFSATNLTNKITRVPKISENLEISKNLKSGEEKIQNQPKSDDEKCLKISKVFSLSDESQFTLVDDVSSEEMTIKQPTDSTQFKLHKTGPSTFEVLIPPSLNLNSGLNSINKHQILPNQPIKKIWRPFEEPQNETEVEIIENHEEVIDLTEFEDDLNSSSSSESAENLIIVEEFPIKQEKGEFCQNYPDFKPQKRKHDDEIQNNPKRQKINDPNLELQRLNQKFIKLILQRAQNQNQEKVVCRFYQCLRCGVKIYLKKVFDHHVKSHKSFSDKEIKVGYAVMMNTKNKKIGI